MSGRAKRAVAWGLLASGGLAAWRALRQSGKGVIMLYHKVNDEGDPVMPALPSRTFERQVDFLRANFQMDTFEGLAAWLAEGAPGRPRAALTFDDGFPDTHDVVLPILAKRGVPATLFLSTGPPETGRPLWVDRLRHMLSHSPEGVLHCPRFGWGPWPLVSTKDRLAARHQILPWIKGQPRAVVDEAMEALADCLRERDIPAARVLRWKEVEALIRGGFSIGGHTRHHYLLSRLSRTEAEDEIRAPIELLRERLGRPITSFAYPNGTYGDFGDEHLEALRASGINCACTTRSDFAMPSDPPLEIPRLDNRHASFEQFAAHVSGFGFRADRWPARESSAP